MKREELVNVGKRIKEARKALNVQQKVMAHALDVSPSHLSEIESGRSNPTTDFHLRLSELYNISVEFLFHGRGEIFYDEEGRVSDDPFDFNNDVDNLPDLIWLLKNSGFIRVSVFTHVTKLIIDEETVIKKSLNKSKSNPK